MKLTNYSYPSTIRLKELYLTERMTWFMQFDSGLRIIVDKDQTMSKLQRLRHLAQSDLKPVWSKISAIDLRYRNGLAIQWKNSIPPKIANGHFVVTIDDTSIAEGSKSKAIILGFKKIEALSHKLNIHGNGSE